MGGGVFWVLKGVTKSRSGVLVWDVDSWRQHVLPSTTATDAVSFGIGSLAA